MYFITSFTMRDLHTNPESIFNPIWNSTPKVGRTESGGYIVTCEHQKWSKHPLYGKELKADDRWQITFSGAYDVEKAMTIALGLKLRDEAKNQWRKENER